MIETSNLDPFFHHLERFRREKAEGRAPEDGNLDNGLEKVASASDHGPEQFPVLVRVPRDDYRFPLAIRRADFAETTRLGTIVSGMATTDGVLRLQQLDGVIVEMSREVGELELDVSVSTVHAHDVAGLPGMQDESQCIVALIDGGIDVHHEAFLDKDGNNRVLCVWDQTQSVGPTPKDRAGFGPFDYGRLHTAEDIASAQGQPLPGLADHHHLGQRHGTHVASIAAGRAVSNPIADGEFRGGIAPAAPIVVVIPRLRTEPGDRQSIGYSKGHVDALAFIDLVATAHKLPVVVNISAGMSAGAHDGSSTLEAAFDAFTRGGRAPGRAIVKSAGNQRELGKHAAFDVTKNGVTPLKLAIPQGVPAGPTIVEAWFSSGEDIQVSVLVDGADLLTCSATNKRPAPEATPDGAVTLTYERFHRDNGESQVIVTLPASARRFELQFRGLSVSLGGHTDVWVEGPLIIDRAQIAKTLTVPGTAHTVITVAASDRSGGLMLPASSVGPTRDGRRKPEIFAPGLGVRAAEAGAKRRAVAMDGTSMAAPHVTGAIALLFSLHRRLSPHGVPLPNAAQVRAALIASTQHLNGHWSEERGYGLLDAAALIKSFDDWRRV